MINIELHAEQLSRGLALYRFHIHMDEIKRALQPILQDVYDIGYDRGIADSYNSLNEIVGIPPDTLQGTIENVVEILHHKSVKKENHDMPSVQPNEQISDGVPANEVGVLSELPSEDHLGTEE